MIVNLLLEGTWRRGSESNRLRLLRTRKLLIPRFAQFAKIARIAKRRYTEGTRLHAGPFFFWRNA
jgi:hypothetical protein